MRRTTWWAALLLAGCASLPSDVLAGPTGSSRYVKVRLLADASAVSGGKPFRAGVKLEMADGWHTYWRNPGDSGLPTKVAWTLPEGWTAGELSWPLPERIVAGPLASYGYHHEVLLFTTITPPAKVTAASVPLAAKVSWLECQEACLPGKAQLDVTLPVAATATPSADAAAFEAAAARVPRPADWKVTATREAGAVHVRFEPPAAARQASFLPGAPGIVAHAEEQALQASGEASVLRVPLDANGTVPERWQGVLVLDGGARAAEIDVPLQQGTGASTPAAAAAAPPPPPAAALPGTAAVTTLPVALGFAFLGGLILNLMPCVLPVLSLKVMSFVRHAGEDPRRAWRHGAAFTAGVLLSFWALAGVLLGLRAAGEQIGWGFQLQSPSFLVMLTGLFFLMGLNLFGVFEMGASLTAAGSLAAGRTGLASSFWGGALATVVATPCTAPFMGSALGFGLSQPTYVALLTFTALALGMASPYLVLSLFPRWLRFVPKSGAWMNSFKQLMGFLLMATVVALLWLFGQHAGTTGMTALLGGLLLMALGAWLYGQYGTELSSPRVRLGAATVAAALVAGGLVLGLARAQAATPDALPGAPSVQNGIVWETFSPEAVARMRADNRAVFVDFTAAWCLTCQVNERVVLSSDRVAERLRQANVATLKADWTHKDEVITRALAEHGRQGVPLYVLYLPGAAAPVLLPEVLTEDLVLAALSTL
jgi:thiol:disulfide interchange protein